MKISFPTMFKYKGAFYAAGDPIEVSSKEAEDLQAMGGYVLDYTDQVESEESAEELSDAESSEESAEDSEDSVEDLEELTEAEQPMPAPTPTRGTRRAGRKTGRAA